MNGMQEFMKRYVVPENAVGKVIRSIHNTIGALNHRKFGKNRRGTVMVTGVSGDRRSDGTFEIVITFCTRRSWVGACDGKRFQMYAFTDFRKPFRMMRILQS